MADELSKDPGSQGGDLGWFTKDKMVPEFADAAFKLEPGQVSGPVKSEFGWHIIKVEGKRDKPFPPFDEVKDQVARYVGQKAQSEGIMKLREAAKIERTEPAPAAQPAPAVAAGSRRRSRRTNPGPGRRCAEALSLGPHRRWRRHGIAGGDARPGVVDSEVPSGLAQDHGRRGSTRIGPRRPYLRPLAPRVYCSTPRCYAEP